MILFDGTALGYMVSIQGLLWAVEAAASAGLLAIAVLTGNLLLRRWLTAGQRALLWGLVLIRLGMPLAPDSPVGLTRLIEFSPLPPLTSEEWLPADVTPPAALTAVLPAPENLVPVAAYALDAASPSTDDFWIDHLSELLPIVWGAGFLLTLFWILVRHWRFCRSARGGCPPGERIESIWRDCRSLADVRFDVRIVMTRAVDQPALLGWWRPRLLLPPECADWSDAELRMAMLHELGHVCRRDVVWNWGLMFLRAAHWWNPVYWLAAWRFRSLRERACDAFALQRMHGDRVADYGRFLLSQAGRPTAGTGWRVALPASLLGFMRSRLRRWSVAARLNALRSGAIVPGKRQRVLAGLLIAIGAACGLTNADSRLAEPTASPPPRIELQAGVWSAAPRDSSTPAVTLVYDVSGVLARCRAQFGDDKIASRELWSVADGALHVDRWWSRTTRVENQDAAAGRAAVAGGVLPHPPAPDAALALEATPAAARVDPGATESDRCQLRGEQLVVTAPPAAHEELRRLLAVWERSGLGQVSVECRIINSPHDLAGPAGVKWRMIAAGSHEESLPAWPDVAATGPSLGAASFTEQFMPASIAVLDDAATRRLVVAAVEASNQRRDATQIIAPKVTLLNGTLGAVQSGMQRPFVVGLSPHPDQGFEPQIVTVTEGTTLLFRAVGDAATRRIHLDCRVRLSSVDDVRTVTMRIGEQDRAIQIPRVQHCQLSMSGDVAPGETLLLGCLPADAHSGFCYVLLTPRIVALEAGPLATVD